MNNEERHVRGHLNMIEERKKNPFSLEQLQIYFIESPATEEEIQALEEYVGHPLPDLYKEICRKYNGGSPDLDCFQDIDGRFFKLGYFCRVTNQNEKGYHIWGVINNFNHVLAKDCLPFACDSLALSIFYLKWVNGQVQVWQLLYGELAYEALGYDDDDEDDEPLYFHMLINESFDAFLGALYAIEE